MSRGGSKRFRLDRRRIWIGLVGVLLAHLLGACSYAHLPSSRHPEPCRDSLRHPVGDLLIAALDAGVLALAASDDRITLSLFGSEAVGYTAVSTELALHVASAIYGMGLPACPSERDDARMLEAARPNVPSRAAVMRVMADAERDIQRDCGSPAGVVVRAKLTFLSAGNVRDVELAAPQAAEGAVEAPLSEPTRACVLRTLRALHLPMFKQKRFSVEYPLRLSAVAAPSADSLAPAASS